MAHSVLLKSIGCRTNQEEMSSLSSKLINAGHLIVDTVENADVVIVNTCLVTAVTESKTRRMISAISRLRPDIKICVTGCLAQQSPLDIKTKLKVNWVVGNSYKHTIPEILRDEMGGVYHDDFGKNTKKSLPVPLEDIPEPLKSNRTRYSVKIQEGCDFSCAYCIVPSVRGPSICASVADIENACKKAITLGYKELVLTGTHIDQFFGNECLSLEDLVIRLASLHGDFRIRLSSLDPRDLTDSFLEIIGSHPKVCRHCHISIQSLSHDVLVAMNRPVDDIETFVNKLALFKQKHPDVGIGGDFIVGFPTETEDMFIQTLDRIKKIGFSYGHVFRYSKRPGTKAALLHDGCDEIEKNNRSIRMRKVLDECHSQFVQTCRHYPQTILVETQEPISGLSSNYLRVTVPQETLTKNSWCKVILIGEDEKNGHCIASIATT